MEKVVLVTLTQNHEWEVYVWKDGPWQELVGLFDTEAEADTCANAFKAPILKGITTEAAYEEAKRLSEN